MTKPNKAEKFILLSLENRLLPSSFKLYILYNLNNYSQITSCDLTNFL